MRASVQLADADLDRQWSWKEYDGDGLRFALLMAHHELRDLAVTIEDERARSAEPITTTQRVLGQFHDAYRDLTGALAGIADGELDREPAPGQWPVRKILEHAEEAQSSFRTAMVLAIRFRREGADRKPTEAEWNVLDVETPLAGDKHAVLESLFDSHVQILRELGDVRDDELDVPSHFWEDTAYPVRFRLHRLEEHLRQHTVQVDKTLVGIGHTPSEAERLVRLLYQAVGRVEAALIGAPGIAPAAQERSAEFIAGLATEVEFVFA